MGRYTSDIFISWDELHRDTRDLCARLLEMQREWHTLIAVTRGGLIPAAVVARELEMRMVDTLCVVSYRGSEAKEQGAAEILKAPDGDGEGCLLIDDLVDTGRTAARIRERLPKATFATVYAKEEGRPQTDLCIREVPQTTWIRFPWDTALSFAPPLVERDSG